MSKENSNRIIVIGIDVSKKKLNLSKLTKGKFSDLEIANDLVSINRYLSKKDFLVNKENYFFVMEATGVYHLLFANELHDKGFKVSVQNPLRIKKFSDMKMIRAKTDSVDARTIAMYGAEQSPELYKPRPKKHQIIIKLLKAIDDCNIAITTLKNQLESSETDPVQSQLVIKEFKNMLKRLQKSILIFEKEIDDILAEIYPDEVKQLNKIKGVGSRTTAVILGFFGKFENFDNSKQVVSFIGINPSVERSGTSIKGKGSIDKKGSPYIRKMLYMSSLAAAQFNPSCKALYDRLALKGKKHKEKRIAVLNKLVRQIFAILKYDREWEANYIPKLR